jgi:hypothetical protein
MVEVGEAENAMEIFQRHQGCPITNDLDLGYVHLHPMFIDNVF